jgi:GDPmannose 4,6-dehydratase
LPKSATGSSGKGAAYAEKGVSAEDGAVRIKIDPGYFRPTEVDYLLGDPSKALKNLGWKPTVSFDELVSMMVKEDLQEAERDHLIRQKGFKRTIILNNQA